MTQRKGRSRHAAAAATMVASLLIGVTLAACGSSSSEGTNSSSSGTASAKRGLVATYGKAAGPVANATWALPYGEPNTLDPANGVYYSASLVTDQLCDTLMRFNPDYSVSPNLATGIAQPNPTTLVIHLRQGVHFWDGQEMTSADVVYSLKHAFDPNASAIGAVFTAVKSVTADGSWQVTIRLSHPDELVLQELPGLAGVVFEKAQAVKAAGSKFGSAQGGIMCTGPYELTQWTPGRSIVITANPRYWDSSRAAHVKQITFTFDTNSTTLAESLLSGQSSGAYEVPAETIPRLSKTGSGTLVYGKAPLYLQLYPARGTGPMASQDLREALFTSIDRAALAKVVYNGAAQPNYTFLNATTWGNKAQQALYAAAYKPFQTAGATWGTDAALTKARQLVKHSGYQHQPIVIGTLAGDATLSQTAQLIQQQGEEIGLNIKIDALQPIQYSDATAEAKARQGLDLLLVVGFNIANDPIEPLDFELLPGSPYNYGNYNDPQVAKLLKEASLQVDPVKSAQLVIQAQSIYEKAWPAATLLNLDEVTFLNKTLSGAVTSFAYLLTPSLASIGGASK
jgi:peptide/nickel transport system substrate-binding protein